MTIGLDDSTPSDLSPLIWELVAAELGVLALGTLAGFIIARALQARHA